MKSLSTLLFSLSTCAILIACSPSQPAGNGNQNTSIDVGHIYLTSPLPGSVVTSPLVIEGEARGYWYFEASFPIRLLDANGNEIAVTVAQAQGDWMTENYVPYTALLEFTATTPTGTLVLQKDNPSGLPENDESLSIPVMFQ